MKILNILLFTLFVINVLTIGLMGHPASAQSKAPDFISVIEGLPLMPGLSEDADGAMSFDTANGRIAETIASGQVVPENVLGYYKGALPQLGWKRLTAKRYRREDEVLIIDITKDDGGAVPVIVHFRLSPTKAK
ncbi:MAG: hypothetical protein QMB78_11260 [Rhodospirillales bacterium]